MKLLRNLQHFLQYQKNVFWKDFFYNFHINQLLEKVEFILNVPLEEIPSQFHKIEFILRGYLVCKNRE